MSVRWVWLALLVASTAWAQTTAMDCVPPLTPDTTASASLVREFEGEMRAEFSAYFDAAQSYIRCLDAASQSARREVEEVLIAHRRLFPEG